MTPYSRQDCPLCGQFYQNRGGAFASVVVKGDEKVLICFLCIRKLVKIGLIQREQLMHDSDLMKRIVEV